MGLEFFVGLSFGFPLGIVVAALCMFWLIQRTSR